MTSWIPGLTVDPVNATRTGCASSPIFKPMFFECAEKSSSMLVSVNSLELRQFVGQGGHAVGCSAVKNFCRRVFVVDFQSSR